MRNAFRLLVGFILGVLVSGSALAAEASPPPNYQGLWWNAPPGSESGWSINLEHHGDIIFATWFTYDVTGDGWWLAMTANKNAEGSYGGALLEATGPAFNAMPFDPARVSRTAVGTGTLTFRDADNATFSYVVKGAQQAKLITRQVFGPLPTCAYATQPEFATATNYEDLWWVAGADESAWGINLTHQGNIIFATWFTYGGDGTPLWLVVIAPRIGQSSTYSGQVIRTTGPAFNAVPFDPAKVTRSVVGTATLTFANGKAGTFAYTLNGFSRTKAITRHSLLAPTGTRCSEPAAVTIKGKVLDPNLAQVLVCADVNGNGRCDPAEAQTLSDATGAYELVAPTGFNGSLVAEVVAGQSRDLGQPGTTVDRPFRMATPSREYSPNITPFTTLVKLSGERNVRLAEDLVRNELGLPPGFRINLDTAPANGSLTQVVAKSVIAALKDTATALDFSSPDALATVVAAFPPALTQLPQLRISTRDGAPITSKEVYVDATFTLTYPAASLPQAELNGRIRGRGNTTWQQPKKPYKVQFTNDASYAKVPDFLGMKKNRNWALLADYLDRSLMRNKLALSLGNSSLFADGLKWNPSGQHLEVILNGEYIGVYLFTEDIRIDSARLNIRKMSSSPAANQVDGGYIVEVDSALDCYNDGKLNLQHQTPHGARICIDTPDEEAITPDQLAYAKNLLDSVESEIYANAGLARINPVSFADWYLLSELFRNQDAAFNSSIFMWKDTATAAIPAERILNLGPLWDFDISAGNIIFFENWNTEGCWVSRTQGFMPSWFSKLFENADFVDLTIARWKEKRPALQKLINSSIATFARRLEPAQARNFQRWQILGVQLWHDYPLNVFPDYAGQVGFLKFFLNERMAWLDKAYATRATFVDYCR